MVDWYGRDVAWLLTDANIFFKGYFNTKYILGNNGNQLMT